MTTRNFNSFKVANTEANRKHCNYLGLPYTISASGKTITVAISQHAYLFAKSATVLKKALGF